MTTIESITAKIEQKVRGKSNTQNMRSILHQISQTESTPKKRVLVIKSPQFLIKSPQLPASAKQVVKLKQHDINFKDKLD